MFYVKKRERETEMVRETTFGSHLFNNIQNEGKVEGNKQARTQI